MSALYAADEATIVTLIQNAGGTKIYGKGNHWFAQIRDDAAAGGGGGGGKPCFVLERLSQG